MTFISNKCSACLGLLGYTREFYVNDISFMCEKIRFDRDFLQEAKDKVDTFFFNYFLHRFLNIKTVSIILKEYKIAME